MKKNFAYELIDIEVRISTDSSDILLLEQLNLRILPGEWISVVGGNGSGKSTLAKLIAGVHPKSEGEIIRGFAGDELFPYVMQHDQLLFGATPWEDVVFTLEAYGVNPAHIPERAVKVLQDVGLEALSHTPVDQLSGGQRQLVAAAGCLAADAPVMLFDEATSMLDIGSRRQVLHIVKQLHQAGKTVIWITHRMDEIVEGDRVVALAEGRIIFDGSTRDFFYDHTDSNAFSNSMLSPCEMFGFEPPFAIQISRELIRNGIQFQQFPLNAQQLAWEVSSIVR